MLFSVRFTAMESRGGSAGDARGCCLRVREHRVTFSSVLQRTRTPSVDGVRVRGLSDDRRQTTLCTNVHSPVDTEGTDCLPRTLEYTRGASKATTRRHNYHRRLAIAVVVSYNPPFPPSSSAAVLVHFLLFLHVIVGNGGRRVVCSY